MKRILHSLCFAVLMLMASVSASAAVTINEAKGWFESGYVTWEKVSGLSYNVYVSPASSDSWTKLDTELVREYPTYGRADALGLKAGQYKFKVVPVSGSAEQTGDATVSDAFTVTAHDRGGFAHFDTSSSTFNPANGIGAYKNDGTLKDGAKVLYITADNAKTITTKVKVGSKDTNMSDCIGIQSIIDAYQKGYDKTPIAFRIIGTLKAENIDHFSSSAEGLQIKGRNAYSEMNITIEGVGKDATIHGFGFLIRNACSVELRNLAIMWCMDDAVSMDTDNCNLWIHNLDLFYGKPGGDADQAKGDGTLDIKGDSRYSTLSYNHLWDSGKASLCGMTSESGPNYLTYHHNWFDHSDSRHPRIRTMSVHVYNNYYDGNSKYGIGSTTGSDVFAENNYFRNCKYPMLTSKQGSDVHNGVGSSDDTKGTFSGEAGGSIKAFGNYMTGQKSFEPYKAGDATYSKHFDAYVVENKTDKVPESVTALLGGATYSNFDTNSSLMYSNYKVDKAEDVKDIVTGELGAGRCQGGDFTWTFGDNEDNNDKVISSLSKAINEYKSTLVGFFGKTISNGGASEEQGGSSDEGSASGSGSNDEDSGDDTPSIEEEAFLAGPQNANPTDIDDYFFFNEENESIVNNYIADGTITINNGKVAGAETSSFVPTYTNITYKKDSAGNPTSEVTCETAISGSLQLAKASAAGKTDGGSVVFRCNKGLNSLKMYLYRTGSVYYNIYKSTNNVNWTKVASVSKAPTGIFEQSYTTEVKENEHCAYIKIENTSTGTLNLQGIRIITMKDASELEPSEVTGGGEGEGGEAGEGDTDATALYKFTVKEKVAGAVKEGQTQNYSEKISTQGGTFVYGNVSKIEERSESATGYGMKLDGDASGSNTKYVKITLDNPLKVGDVINITCFATTAGNGVAIYADQTKDPLATYATKTKTEETFSIKVTEDMAGLTEFYVCRLKGKSAYFTGITITGTSTCITDINVAQPSTAIYSLDGRSIAEPQKGQLYIVNGKKYIAK